MQGHGLSSTICFMSGALRSPPVSLTCLYSPIQYVIGCCLHAQLVVQSPGAPLQPHSSEVKRQQTIATMQRQAAVAKLRGQSRLASSSGSQVSSIVVKGLHCG